MSRERGRTGGAHPRIGAPRPVSGHTARKRFGQHFLTDRAVLQGIVDAIDPRPGQALLEIGPGLGALTAGLLDRIPRLAAVEIDRDLAQRLRRRWPDALCLFEADALEFDPALALAAYEDPCGAVPVGKLRVVGNLPYNISSPLLLHWLGHRHQVSDQHFLLQKEVVDRIVAPVGSAGYGRLAVLLQTFYALEALFDVPPEAFDPPPRVHSAVLRMTVRSEAPIADPAPLQQVLAAAFAQRRKMVRSTLLPWLAQRGVQTSGIAGDQRPEDLPLEVYWALARELAR